jgi:hypothetical protein
METPPWPALETNLALNTSSFIPADRRLADTPADFKALEKEISTDWLHSAPDLRKPLQEGVAGFPAC